jgi:hypothetical protein
MNYTFRRILACKEFGDLDEQKYTLYRLNAHDEPAFPLRRDNAELSKSLVASGDQLIL